MTIFERKVIKPILAASVAIVMPILIGLATPSTHAQSPAAPAIWMPPISNVRVSGGTPVGKSLLSVGADGSYADLYKMDDRSGRQRWLFQRSPDGVTYNILIAGGTPADRKYLSAAPDGRKVSLEARDDGSGRQRWMIGVIPIESGSIPRYKFQFMITGGTFRATKYLSTSASGGIVDLYDKDDGSGRQNWVMDVPDGVRLNVSIAGGISNGKQVLGKSASEKSIDLYTAANSSSLQRWTFTRWGFGDSYSIWTPSINAGTGLFLTGSGRAPVGGVALSALGNTGDGGASAGQDWVIEDIGSGMVRIKRASGDLLYLSATSDGSKVDTFNRDDGSGRQRWRIVYVP